MENYYHGLGIRLMTDKDGGEEDGFGVVGLMMTGQFLGEEMKNEEGVCEKEGVLLIGCINL